MRQLLVIFFMLVFMSSSDGQQLNQHSQYMFNKYAYNPAFAGLDFSLSANLVFRNQWEGLSSNPSDIQLSAHIPYYIWNGALGGLIDRQSVGVFTKTDLAGSYNYVASLPFGLLSLGGRFGITYLTVDGSGIITPDGEYTGIFTHNDPILLETLDAGISPRWDIGAYFFNKEIEAGVSIAHLPRIGIALDRTSFTQTTHATAYFQYNWKILNEFDFTQSILLKTDFNEVQTDISSIIKINGNIFGGIGLRGYSSRSIDALTIILGTRIGENYTLSYGYDVGLSNLVRAHEGSHEILLNYNLRKTVKGGKLPNIIYNPRYL